MTYPYGDAFRREVAARCATFPRLPAGDASRGLKASAVAIALTQAQDGSAEATFLLTKRTDRLRAHGGQWALPGGRCDAGETFIETALRELSARGLMIATSCETEAQARELLKNAEKWSHD